MKHLELIFDGNTLLGKKLYHYTDTNGFFGILKTKKVWATDYKFLNDPSEHFYGRSIVKKVLEELIEENSDIPVKSIYEMRFGSSPIKYETFSRGYYICSLTEEKDSLEQWRAYGNNGKGFAIEFDIDSKYIGGEIDFLGEIPHKLLKVIYNAEEQNRITRATILSCIQSKEMNLLDIDFLINYLCIKFKDPCYANEKEWRIVYSPLMKVGSIGSDIQFRESRDCLINYHTFELEKITGVSIGPRRPDSDAQIIFQMFIDYLKLFTAEVYKSPIQYIG
jgi:hypothetical protein